MIIETDYRALLSAGQEGLPLNAAGGVVAIGNFDGVHRGHQELLRQGKTIAQGLNAPLTVLTFTPHPRQYFNSELPPFLLSDAVLKRDLLLAAGADAVVEIKFDGVLAQVTAEQFIENVLFESLQAKHIIVGDNFVFGSQRRGNVATLQQWGEEKHFTVTALPAVNDANGLRISSERIREALRNAQVSTADELLGHPWQMRGEVIHGDKRGRTIDFPTANILLGDFLRPKFGVYAAWVTLEESGEKYQAMLNIGIRPTFELPLPMLEVHLFGFNSDLYGKTLRVTFCDFLRPEQKFLGPADLKAQLRRDKARAQHFLANPL